MKRHVPFFQGTYMKHIFYSKLHENKIIYLIPLTINTKLDYFQGSSKHVGQVEGNQMSVTDDSIIIIIYVPNLVKKWGFQYHFVRIILFNIIILV